METKINLAVQWLIRNAQYDEDTDELYYRTENDHQKVVMKTYSRGSLKTAVYVPATGYQVGWTRAVEAVKNGYDAGRSVAASIAAQARWGGRGRSLPRNVYPMSNGQFIGRKGKNRTLPYDSVDEAEAAVKEGRWVEA